jgi:two-component system, LytTR family, sensor kinase
VPHEFKVLNPEQFLLTTLMVQLAIVATLATMLVRFRRFRRILLTERRDWPERLTFTVAVGIPLLVGVLSRLLLGYQAADLSLSGPFLAGLIAGPYAGALVGVMMGVPPTFAGEYGALPFSVGCGFAGGGLREVCPKEAIWHFSPFVFTGLHRYAWRFLRRFQIDWQIVLIAPPIALELLRQWIDQRYEQRIFALHGTGMLTSAMIILATVLSVAIPIKIWNSARIEHKLQEQEKLLMTARIEALASQINPHFLFNTLTSISSLIRTQPDTARTVIVKLSALLRRLMRSQDHFVTLREELDGIDEYLDIECVRFGPNLTVRKDITRDALDQLVPSMILQPIVENSLKHGLSGKVGTGQLTIHGYRHKGHVILEVVDNGTGMSAERLAQATDRGIGLRNVNERLRVIYGATCQIRLHSIAGEGTSVRLEIPELAVPERASA